jgi:hypothetical protein
VWLQTGVTRRDAGVNCEDSGLLLRSGARVALGSPAQHLLPGGQVCSGFFSLLGRAVLPVTSLGALVDGAGLAVLEGCPGAHVAPTGHVASGLVSLGGRLGPAVCAETAPAESATPVIRLRRSLGIITSSDLVHNEARARANRGWAKWFQSSRRARLLAKPQAPSSARELIRGRDCEAAARNRSHGSDRLVRFKRQPARRAQAALALVIRARGRQRT